MGMIKDLTELGMKKVDNHIREDTRVLSCYRLRRVKLFFFFFGCTDYALSPVQIQNLFMEVWIF
jgi:hypothetical protein